MLRTFSILALLIMAMALSPQLADAGMAHHDLHVRLFPEDHRLEAVDSLSLSPGSGRIQLRLHPAVEIEEITLAGRPVSYSFERGLLDLRLPQVTGEKETLRIAYSGTFNDPVPKNPVNTEDPSYGVAGSISPEGVFLSGGTGWYPQDPEHPSSYRIAVEAPAGFHAVTEGKRVRSDTTEDHSRSEWKVDYPARGVTLAAGPYVLQEAEAGPVQVYTYFYPPNSRLANNYLQSVQDYLKLYRDLLGPYPFSKFAVVENFFPTGYGFPSWTLLGSRVVALPFIVTTSLGHEVAHSWWGNGVWVDYSRGNWSEGLTTYVADHLYKQRESAEEARQYRLKILRDYASLVPPEKDFPLTEFVSRSSAAEQAVGYGKSAMVFHMARQRMGGEAPFWQGLRAVATEKMFQRAAWGDFAHAFERVSGAEMSPFFHQWVERPGAPVLELQDVRSEKIEEGWKVTGVVRQQPPFFDLLLPLRLETEGEVVEATLASSGAETPFSMISSARPQRLIIDPEVDIFRRLDIAEIPPTVNGIRGSSSLLVIQSSVLPPETADASQMLLRAMGKEGAAIRQEKEIDPKDLAGHDLLFLGVPQNRQLLPPFPAGLTLSAEGLTLQSETYESEETAVFAALPHPFEEGRTAALFLPGSGEAASVAGRKIPHYGKYSYLAFVAGQNVDKGIWPVRQSPVIHTFEKQENTK